MSTYVYPEMPLRMRCWFSVTTPPPTGEPDIDDEPCSLSPLKQPDFWRFVDPDTFRLFPSHIIRCAVRAGFADNQIFFGSPYGSKMSVFEIPIASSHFYVCIWAHIVGAGFANEHSRIYVARWSTGLVADEPFFQGWI